MRAREFLETAPLAIDNPVLPMHSQKGSTRLQLYTTIETRGIPQDITLQELRVESFFPMDQEIRMRCRRSIARFSVFAS
jgi:hypothetical protein